MMEFGMGKNMSAVDTGNFYALSEDVQDWISEADNLGPHGDLGEMKALRDRAPEAAKESETYRYLNRSITYRDLHDAE